MERHSWQKGAPPEAMLRCPEGDRSTRILANQLLGSRFDPFQAKMSERLRDKVRHRVGTVLIPNVEGYSSLPLQKPHFSLYYAIRPVRSSGRYGQRLFGCVLR
jgi:hypothetical protein